MKKFSCVNTRLAFDAEIFLPNLSSPDNDETNVLQKDYNYKICYKLKLDTDKDYNTYRVMSKILKLDENNQYSFAMTKPMPTGCIKFDSDISWKTFNYLLETADLDDKIGQDATQKQRAYNEISPPIIEKQKITDIYERSTNQLLEQYKENSDGTPKSYRATKKADATLF